MTLLALYVFFAAQGREQRSLGPVGACHLCLPGAALDPSTQEGIPPLPSGSGIPVALKCQGHGLGPALHRAKVAKGPALGVCSAQPPPGMGPHGGSQQSPV